MSRDHSKPPSRYNQQFFRDWGGAGPLAIGLVAIVLVAIGFYLAFTKSIPFTSPGYQVNATFSNAVNIAINSPIRIAGINVGKVTDVEPAGDNTTVTFTVDEEGRPLRTDASAQIRPRLFLEGNWFVDLDPGTPEAAELPDGGVIPVSRTATSVQTGDILRNVLQLPQRANLQKLLAGLGTGLNAKPRPVDELTFEPFVEGLSGGEALNLLYRNGETAARGTAIVNAAYLGKEPNDLGNALRGLGRLTGTLNERQDDVQNFVRNFETFTGALAAESDNLATTIQELPGTLRIARTSLDNLNRSLPALRGFAIAITPGVNEIPRTIREVRPLTNQLKPLLTKSELRGLAAIIKRNTPASTTSIRQTLAFLPQLRDFGRCVAGNIAPTGDQVIVDGGLGNGQKASREFLYATAGFAGATSGFDGNGPFVRFQTGGGPVSVKVDDPEGGGINQTLYARTFQPTLGTSPVDNGAPPIVTSERCFTQDVPDLNGPAAGPGPANPEVYTPVKRAIKTHFKDFIAISVMVLIALATLLIILSNQKAALPAWVPGLGQDFYSINAEFETAQAITPGQGQAAVIAGINVGKVGAAELQDGVAKVRLDIDPKYRDLMHQDAEFLLRPKTGLNDMVVEIDPGTTGPPPEEGSTLPLAQGLSNVQLDQFWATLDRDTQDYLVLLLNGAGVGLDGKGRELSQALRRFGPFTVYTARLNGLLEKRRDNIRRNINALSQIATELGNNDQVVADFVTNSKNNLQAWADEEASLREALQELPPTLLAAQDGLSKSNQLSLVLRPTLLRLIPGAKNLKTSLQALQSLGRNVTPLVRDEIRPFTRNVQPVFNDLGNTSRQSEVTTKQVKGFYVNLNRLLDMWAYNPPGDTQEGFLFWSPWLAHNTNSSANAQDAAGPVRRGISMINCNAATLAQQALFWSPLNQNGIPQIETIYRLAQLPPPTNPVDGGICTNVPPVGP